MGTKTRNVVIGIGLLIVFMMVYYRLRPLATTVSTGKTSFTVEVAMTKAEQERGLSHRDSLAPGHGMLFVFRYVDRHAFWMKDMRFPLDIVWLYGNRIMDITYDVPVPTDYPLPIYRPSAQVDRVLEINAGEATAAGLKIGDTVTYRN